MAQRKPDPARINDTLARMDEFVAIGLIGQHTVATRLGINVTDLTCLGHILGAGGEPLAAGDLAELAGLTTGAVTGVLNRLERAGYARRLADPADRRRIRIVPDPAAAARLGAAYGPFYDKVRALFATHDESQLAVLAAFFTRGAQYMRETIADLDTA